MDLCYYINQIKEELDGSIDYVKRAINCKREHPDWAATFEHMSEMELDHALSLQKIFNEDFINTLKEYQDVPDFILDIKANISNMITEYNAKIKYMHQMYSNK